MTEPLHEPERRKGYKEIAKTIDERMAYLEKCFKRWLRLGLIGWGIIGLTSAIALFGFGIVLNEQRHTDQVIKALAVGANKQSKTAINTVLQQEKVCSDSADMTACQALFNRLARSITDEQRYRLGCASIKELRGSVADQIRRENPKCGR